jgi:hypothetical protein
MQYLDAIPRCYYIGCAITLIVILYTFIRMQQEKRKFDEWWRKNRKK